MQSPDYYPLVILAAGIATVIGMILVLRLNAFIALITSAILVSLMSPIPVAAKISRVAEAFGATAGNIGIVIALAAIIGVCLMESGAADRIVRAFLKLLGERNAPMALMGSGFVLAVPVFFDTVFYLLVPLARSLYRRTKTHYLKYVLAIACGGAITHTLVPPTPGPLLVASTIGVDLGVMILVGIAVSLPSAIAGLAFGAWADRAMPTPMRPLADMAEPTPPPDDKLPPLGLAVLPVLLPVLLISTNTVLNTFADAERAARLKASEIVDWPAFAELWLGDEPIADGPNAGIETRMRANITPELREALERAAADLVELDDVDAAITGLNEQVLAKRSAERSLAGEDLRRKSRAEVERANRQALEAVVPESVLKRHHWQTLRRQVADYAALVGNANFALLLAAAVSLSLVVRQRGSSRADLAKLVEHALMSGGVIILITSAGGAFGAMLAEAEIGDLIQASSQGNGSATGLGLMLLGFGVAAVLKVAQGSSTVAMITAAGILAALVPSAETLGYHPAYLATAIGSGSLMGSWMNDSGFWVFAKMSGLTEAEALKSWTPLLLVLGVVGLAVSAGLAVVLPLTSLG